MKAIILKSHHKINGTLFDVIEYYLCLLEQHVDIKLIIIGDSRFTDFYKIFEEKYYLKDLNWKANIIFLKSKSELIKYKFSQLLLFDYTTIDYCYDVLFYDEVYVITNKINRKLKKSIYFTELWNDFYYDRKYIGKFLFSRYKNIEKFENNTFINFLADKKWNRIFYFENLIVKSNRHEDGLFEKFDRYVYITDGSIFDCHPRMFHECYFYNKKIEYININNVRDGAYYRYNDLYKNGLCNRYLNKEDDIIKMFL